MDIAALAAELAAGHPITGAYSLDDAIAADELNAVNVEVNVESVLGQAIFEAAPIAEQDALTDRENATFLGIVGMGQVFVNATNTKAAILELFGPGTETRTNLAALQKKTISRATELEFGTVRAGDIQRARAM